MDITSASGGSLQVVVDNADGIGLINETLTVTVTIFAVPREYLPFDRAKSLMLKEIVDESSASTSFSMSTFGLGWFEYKGYTLFIHLLKYPLD